MKLYTSDLHFAHVNIIKYEERPFINVDEMDKVLIANWNAKVKRGDEIYILGDFAFCRGAYANFLLNQLNGRKYLIKGNHDSFLKDKEFDRSKFEWIKNYAKVTDDGNKIIMFHYPIAVWDSAHHGSIHLYGHVHSNKDNHHPLLADLGNNAINVGVDVQGYEPKTLRELLGQSVSMKHSFHCESTK